MTTAEWILFAWFVLSLVAAPVLGKWLKEHVR